MEYYEKNGLMMRPTIEVPIKTNNGYAIKDVVDSPYPFSRRAVVVAVPDGVTSFSVGDYILLDKHVIMATKVNESSPFHLAKGFTTDSWSGIESPTLMSDPHYGYLLVEPNTEILGTLKQDQDDKD